MECAKKQYTIFIYKKKKGLLTFLETGRKGHTGHSKGNSEIIYNNIILLYNYIIINICAGCAR